MSNKPRAAFFLPSLSGGGAERALLQVANAFAARGLSVDLVVGDEVGPYAAEVSANVKVVPLRKKRVIACLPALIRYLRNVQPSVLVSTMMHANIVAVVARILSRQSARVVVRESNVPEVWNGKPLHQGKSLLLHIAGFVYPYADAVVCVSSGVQSSLVEGLKLDSALTRVIMNPVVSEEFFALASIAPVFPCSALSDGPYVIAVGRLEVVKGFDALIEAFAEYRKVHPINLLILGEGSRRKPLQALAEQLGIADHVFMPGFIANPFPLMKQADLFVMSSRREGLPNALIQAIALKRPAVVTQMPDGPVEILDNDRYGITVPIDNAEALCAGMLAATSRCDWPSPDRAWYSRFSEESVVDQYLAACSLSVMSTNVG